MCEAGKTESQDCGNCGSQKRTCSNSCQWGAYGACGGEGPCKPGDEDQSDCESCSHKVCSDSCQWSACKLKAGSACNWEKGTNWQCCGNDKWQFCSSACQWNPCASCGTSCSSNCN